MGTKHRCRLNRRSHACVSRSLTTSAVSARGGPPLRCTDRGNRLAEHRLAVGAVHVLGEDQHRGAFSDEFFQHTAAVGEFEWSQILAPEVQEVEGVEAGTRLAVPRQQTVEVGEPGLAMRDGLAVDDEVTREVAQRRGDRDEFGRPAAKSPISPSRRRRGSSISRRG